MEFGSLDALVNATEKVCYDSGELAAPVTSVTISGLDGDVDEEYTLYIRLVGGYATAVGLRIRPNNDTGTNYGYQFLDGTNATASAARGTDSGFLTSITSGTTLGKILFSTAKIYAKSGQVRTAIINTTEEISTTTVTCVTTTGQSWNNTVDNITSLVLTASQVDGIGIGSRIILMRKITATTNATRTGIMNVGQPLVNATVNRSCTLKGQWQTIYKNTLAAAATSVTISGLDGNTDTMYRLNVRHIGATAVASQMKLTFNTDTSGDHYGYQYLAGQNTTASAGRDATENWWYITALLAGQVTDRIALSTTYIYAKSGKVRTAITDLVEDINTTTINAVSTIGQAWSNTADNITQMVFTSTVADGIGIGTEITLERLIP